MSDSPDYVPTAQKSSWTSFIKELAKAGSSDLSSLSAPAFILSPVSIIEFPSYWAENVNEFERLSNETEGWSPEERMLKVLEWFLGTFSGQFTAREQATGSEKKPLNAFLGEQFIGEWNGGETALVSEQVSHHPPITAYMLENTKKGVSWEGSCAQKTSFTGRAITVKQVGHGLLRINLPRIKTTETYLITLPKLIIEGIFFGKPYVELCESSTIMSASGLRCQIDYSGKGYFSGKSHTFTANITQSPSITPLYTIHGQWNATSTFTHSPASSSHPVGSTFCDFDKVVKVPMTVKELDDQGEFESRRVWREVADGIRKGDFTSASEAKIKIEVAERQKRKDELAAGTPFVCRLFTTLTDDPEYHQLAVMCKHKPENEPSYKVISH